MFNIHISFFFTHDALLHRKKLVATIAGFLLI